MEFLVFSLVVMMSVLGSSFGQGKIPAPVFSLDSAAPTTFTISWQHPSTPATITGWRIQYREAGQKKKQIDLRSPFTEQLITDLKPSTQYKVRIMAKTDQGNGKYSSWLAVLTQAEISNPSEIVAEPEPEPASPIPGSPQNMEAVATSESCRITWDPPAENSDSVIGYVLSYGPVDNPRENVFTMRPDPTYTDLNDLRSNVQYQVALTAYNSYGQSYPARVKFVTVGVIDEVIEPLSRTPPAVQDVQYVSLSPTSMRITWTLPSTTPGHNEIESIRFGFGDASIPVDYLPASEMARDATNYIAEQLSPSSQYTIMLITQNRYGQSDPVVMVAETSPAEVPEELETPQGPEQVVIPPPTQLRADVLSPTSVRVTFVDPSLDSIQDVSSHERYYTLRYQRDGDVGYEYANLRETTHIVDYLQPQSNYVFEVMVVLSRDHQSEYGNAVYAFTRDQTPKVTDDEWSVTKKIKGYLKTIEDVGTALAVKILDAFNYDAEGLPSDVTAIQVKVTNPGLLSAVINWLPPHKQMNIQGYVLEFTAGTDDLPGNSWERMAINGDVPSATIKPLMANTTYHVRVAPRIAGRVTEFSDPPEIFLTPTVPPSDLLLVGRRHPVRFPNQEKGQPLQQCSDSETKEHVVDRVRWMRDGGITRPALVGVPLPYCDDYFGIHECHGVVCFCIPGKRPRTDAACSGDLDGLQGDQPVPGSSSAATPCRAEYESARRAIAEARKTGTAPTALLPYCTDEGHYQPKQCSGTMCYCATWDGKHTGKEMPVWEAASLDCCEYC